MNNNTNFKIGDQVWIYYPGHKPVESIVSNIETFSSSFSTSSHLPIIDCFPGFYDDCKSEPIKECFLYHRPSDKQKLINEISLDIEALERYIEELNKN
jgi:hypothetical protein